MTTRKDEFKVESVAVRCGRLEIDANGAMLNGTVKLDGVEQDWISELKIEWKVGALPTVTLIGPLVPPVHPSKFVPADGAEDLRGIPPGTPVYWDPATEKKVVKNPDGTFRAIDELDQPTITEPGR